MALSKSALSDLLDALRAGGDLDLIREALALVLQTLIDAQATQHIGARPYERSEQRTAHRNSTRARLLSTKAGDVERRIPSSGRARCSRRCWSPDGASTGPCWRWSWRPMCMALPPARSTTWSRRWAWRLGSPSRRSPGSAPNSTPKWPRSGPLAGPHQLSVPVRGRHLPQGPHRRPSGQPGSGDRHRRDR
jgi:hypothetical protein